MIAPSIENETRIVSETENVSLDVLLVVTAAVVVAAPTLGHANNEI